MAWWSLLSKGVRKGAKRGGKSRPRRTRNTRGKTSSRNRNSNRRTSKKRTAPKGKRRFGGGLFSGLGAGLSSGIGNFFGNLFSGGNLEDETGTSGGSAQGDTSSVSGNEAGGGLSESGSHQGGGSVEGKDYIDEINKEKSNLEGLTKEKSGLGSALNQAYSLSERSAAILQSYGINSSDLGLKVHAIRENNESDSGSSTKPTDKGVAILTGDDLMKLIKEKRPDIVLPEDKFDRMIQLLEANNELIGLSNKAEPLELQAQAASLAGQITSTAKNLANLRERNSQATSANQDLKNEQAVGVSEGGSGNLSNGSGEGTSKSDSTSAKALGLGLLLAGVAGTIANLFSGDDEESEIEQMDKEVAETENLTALTGDRDSDLESAKEIIDSERSGWTDFERTLTDAADSLTFGLFGSSANVSEQKRINTDIKNVLTNDKKNIYAKKNYGYIIKEALAAYKNLSGSDKDFKKFSDGRAMLILNTALGSMLKIDRMAALNPKYKLENYQKDMYEVIGRMRNDYQELYGKTAQDYQKFMDETRIPVYAKVQSKTGSHTDLRMIHVEKDPILSVSDAQSESEWKDSVYEKYFPNQTTFSKGKLDYSAPIIQKWQNDQTSNNTNVSIDELPQQVNTGENAVQRLTTPVKLPTMLFGTSNMLTSNYLEKRPERGAGYLHKGIDVSAQKGQDIITPLGGEVTAVDGGKIDITSENGLVSRYYHTTSQIPVGTKVEPGDSIAKVRYIRSKDGTGPHVHMETWQGGKTINPLKVIMEKTTNEVGPDDTTQAKGKGDAPETGNKPVVVNSPTYNGGSTVVNNNTTVNIVSNDSKRSELS